MMKDIFKTNWFLVVVSILSAIVIWVYVVYQINPMYETTIRNVPVNYTGMSDDFDTGKFTILSTNSENVDIKIRGKRSVISKLKKDNINCSVNMSDVVADGSYTLPFSINFNVDGIEVLSKNPYNIVLNIDDVVTKEKEINIDTQGKPEDGFIAESVEYSPLKIRLTGARSIVNKIDSAGITVDLNGATDTISGRYKVKLYDKNGEEFTDDRISKNVTYTELKYNIFQAKSVEVSASLSSDTNNLGKKIKVSKIKPSKVTVIGDKRELMNIDKLKTKKIDVSNIKDGDTVTVELDELPENTRLEGDSMEVEITFKTTDNQ